MHRVLGPYRGYFIAVYTTATRNGFVGYGRATVNEPRAVWRARAHGDLVSAEYRNEEEALIAADHKIRNELDQMPPNWDPFTTPGELR